MLFNALKCIFKEIYYTKFDLRLNLFLLGHGRYTYAQITNALRANCEILTRTRERVKSIVEHGASQWSGRTAHWKVAVDATVPNVLVVNLSIGTLLLGVGGNANLIFF